jgi:putative FmdB family regulatory protein
MPIYEYYCHACETRFEELIREKSADHVHCPECGTEHVSRLLSLFATSGTSNFNTSEVAEKSGAHACGCGHCHCGHG